MKYLEANVEQKYSLFLYLILELFLYIGIDTLIKIFYQVVY